MESDDEVRLYYDNSIRAENYKEKKANCCDCGAVFSWRVPTRGRRSKLTFGRCAVCAERMWFMQRLKAYQNHRGD